MEVRPALFARPVAASSDYDRAVSAFVSESNSAEGRSLKMRGIERLRELNPALSAEHVRAIASFVNNSTGLEGRSLKLDGLARIMQIQPALTPSAIRSLAGAVDESETLEGRRAKLQGFQRLYQAQPALSEDVLGEMGRLVCGSNGVEGYSMKFDYLSRMLKVQPGLSADFVRQLRLLVDESNGVKGRRLKLQNVLAMLEKQPGLSPAMLRATTGYVNESNSLEGRGLKLGSLVGMLSKNPALKPSQVEALASGVNACPGMPSRRAAVAGYEAVLEAAPALGPDVLREMGRFLSQPGTDVGRTEYTRMAVQVVQGDPGVSASTFGYLRQATAGAYTALDGTARATLAYNDLLIARGLGKRPDELATLKPAAGASEGACLSLPLQVLAQLRNRPELELCQRNIDEARQQANRFEQALQGSTDQVIQANYERYSQLWEQHREGLNGKLQLAGLGLGVAAAVGMLFIPGVRSLAAIGLFGGVFLGSRLAKKPLQKIQNKKLAGIIRTEMEPVRDGWKARQAAQEAQQVRVEAYLAADLWETLKTDPNRIPPGQNVREGEDAVVIGGIRVPRRRPELDIAAPLGPQGFDTANPGQSPT